MPEVRLTVHASDHNVRGTVAARSEVAGEVAVAWSDSAGSGQVQVAIVGPDGAMRA